MSQFLTTVFDTGLTHSCCIVRLQSREIKKSISVPFLMTAAPGDLTFKAGATAVAREDTELLQNESTTLNWNPM